MGLCSHRNSTQSYINSREQAVATNLLGFFLHSHSHDHDLHLQLTHTLDHATAATCYLPPTRTQTQTQRTTEPLTYAPSAEAYSFPLH